MQPLTSASQTSPPQSSPSYAPGYFSGYTASPPRTSAARTRPSGGLRRTRARSCRWPAGRAAGCRIGIPVLGIGGLGVGRTFCLIWKKLKMEGWVDGAGGCLVLVVPVEGGGWTYWVCTDIEIGRLMVFGREDWSEEL